MFILLHRDENGRLAVSGSSQKTSPEEAVRDIIEGSFGEPLWVVEIQEGINTFKRRRVHIETTIGGEV